MGIKSSWCIWSLDPNPSMIDDWSWLRIKIKWNHISIFEFLLHFIFTKLNHETQYFCVIPDCSSGRSESCPGVSSFIGSISRLTCWTWALPLTAGVCVKTIYFWNCQLGPRTSKKEDEFTAFRTQIIPLFEKK